MRTSQLADSERMRSQYTEKLLEDVGVLPWGTGPEVAGSWLSLGFRLACALLALALTMFAAAHGGRPRWRDEWRNGLAQPAGRLVEREGMSLAACGCGQDVHECGPSVS